MSSNIEKLRLKLTSDPTVRSIGESNGLHCVQPRDIAPEPLAQADFRLFQLALTEDGGVPAKDAQKQAKELKKRYNQADHAERERLADVMGHAFEGLMRPNRPELQLIPVGQEVVIYRASTRDN